MVNPGAIATTSMVPGGHPDEKWEFLREGLSRFAGRELTLDTETFASASATNAVNRAIGDLLRSRGRLRADPDETVDLYTRQSCLNVTARDLAVMAATLAGGGFNPLTGEQVADQLSCRCALVVMATAGLYEASGEWLQRVGLPGKSGIGGGIVMVSPGKGGLGTFAPRLDAAGNSVKGQLAAALLSRSLGLDLFVSEPLGRS
jgi:glutaminase